MMKKAIAINIDNTAPLSLRESCICFVLIAVAIVMQTIAVAG
jgi:hypothetical protein